MNVSAAPQKHWLILVIGWICVAHLGALGAFFSYSLGAVLAGLVLYFLTASLGIGLGFHRFLTHGSIRLPRAWGYLLALLGTLALQGSPLQWVAHHRMHHGGSDTPRDPHDASQGFLFSHLLWMLKYRPEFDSPERMRRFLTPAERNDPFLAFLSLPATMIGLQVAAAALLWAMGGISWVVWGSFVRIVAVYHVTWLVNSAAHLWGYRNFQLPDTSTNNWWVALLTFGEGWHNNHHAHPEDVLFQKRWWEWDVTGWIALALIALGIGEARMLDTRTAKN